MNLLRYSTGERTRFEPAVRGERHMKIDGHCHCGRITFEAKVDPDAITICHCTDCQTLTGSAFAPTSPLRPRVSCSAAAHRRAM
jgi:hypothetical protein